MKSIYEFADKKGLVVKELKFRGIGKTYKGYALVKPKDYKNVNFLTWVSSDEVYTFEPRDFRNGKESFIKYPNGCAHIKPNLVRKFLKQF